MTRFISGLVLLTLLVMSPGFTFAQEDAPVDVPLFPSLETSEATGPLNCFDYYQFGSVQADLQTDIAQTVPGAELTFTGTVTNANNYPLVDGTLYVKIFKLDEATFAEGDGNEVVDQFVIAGDIILPALGSVPQSYTWKVPMNAEGGEYYAAYFFATNDRYNLMGLSFTDDVVGNTAPFMIASDNQIAKLRKIDTTINDRNHHFAAVPLTFSATETVTIRTTITNPTDTVMRMPLQWNQYAWDAMNPDNRRNTKTEVVTLAPNETKELTYTTKEQREPVVYITAIADDQGSRSILNIRYVRDGIEETRINFPGITTFPLMAEQQVTLFACAHSTNEPIVSGNTLTLTLADKAGSLIHEYQYEGDIAGTMSGFGEAFTPVGSHDYVLLTATLKRDGVVVEEVQIEYDCQAIDPNSCLPEPPQSFLDKLVGVSPTVYGGAILILVLFALAWILYRRHKDFKNNHIDAMSNTTKSSLLFVLLLSSFFFMPSGDVEATKTTQWSWTDTEYYYYSGQRFAFVDPIYNPALRAPAGSITYRAKIVDTQNGSVIPDLYALTEGTVFRVESTPHASADISWFGTGYSGDSPNGYWVPGAAPPGDMPDHYKPGNCEPQQYVGSDRWFGVYIPLTVNPPGVTYTVTGPVTPVSGNDTFRVTGDGTINVAVNFGPTFGRYYYRYHDSRDLTPGPGCYRNFLEDTPLFRGWANTISGTTYQLDVPRQTISFRLTGVSVNNRPSTPIITGPSAGQVGSAYTFSVQATDPDGDRVRYGITDFDCSDVNQWLTPWNVTSGASVNFSRSWITPGEYTIYVLARDENGLRSPSWECGTHTITIVPAASPRTATLTVNGSGGPLTVNKTDTLNLAWNSTNAANCTLYGTGLPGGSVALSGSASVSARELTSNSPESYVFDCGAGALDEVEVTVINQPPVAPSIVGPNAGEGGVMYSFAITATDPDGDDLYYEIDWNNDGIADAISPGSSDVPSGVSIIAERAWSTSGGNTFQARAVDTDNSRSNWTPYTVQVTNSVPPTATIEARVNTGPWSPADQTIDPGDTVAVRWDSTGATTCTGTNFNTGGAVSDIQAVPAPAPNNSIEYGVSCSGTGGSGGDTIRITVNDKPNFTEPSVTHTLSTGFDEATGVYDSVTVRMSTNNNGGSATKSTAQYRVQFDSRPPVTGTIPLLAQGDPSDTFTHTFNNVPFGPHTVRVEIDTPIATGGSVDESNEDDNDRDYTFGGAIPPPDPQLTLTVDKDEVRAGDTVQLTWNTVGMYPTLECRLFGPTIDELVGFTGTRLSSAIQAKSEYTFTCTETTSNASWSTSVSVEVAGSLEEI